LQAEAIQQFKKAAFQVISKDKGFAPVVANFAARGVSSIELFKAIDHVLSIKNLYISETPHKQGQGYLHTQK
jgi:hypothetical protein